MYLNQINIAGNLGTDPKVFPTTKGSVVSMFMLLNDSYTDREGNKIESTTPITIKVFGKWAETAALFKKGENIYVEGRLQENKWNDKETGKERSTLEIRAVKIGKMVRVGVGVESKVSDKKTKPAVEAFDTGEIPF